MALLGGIEVFFDCRAWNQSEKCATEESVGNYFNYSKIAFEVQEQNGGSYGNDGRKGDGIVVATLKRISNNQTIMSMHFRNESQESK